MLFSDIDPSRTDSCVPPPGGGATDRPMSPRVDVVNAQLRLHSRSDLGWVTYLNWPKGTTYGALRPRLKWRWIRKSSAYST